MKAIERLYQYLEHKGIKTSHIAKDLDISRGYLTTQLKRKADLGSGILEKIFHYCEDLSPNWLMTGRGEMLRNSKNVNVQHSQNTAVNGGVSAAPPDIEPKLEALKKEIAEKNTEITFLRKTIENMQEQITFLQTQTKKR